jgi:hypothetical protein
VYDIWNIAGSLATSRDCRWCSAVPAAGPRRVTTNNLPTYLTEEQMRAELRAPPRGGSRQPNNIIPQAPELKNMSTASMLYVFGL